MEKLTLEEYKALGDAIKQANKNLKLIQKFLLIKDITFTTTSSGNLIDALSNVMCDLDNLSHALENKMDDDYLNDVIDTIDYFN